jgi:hypothetical protein
MHDDGDDDDDDDAGDDDDGDDDDDNYDEDDDSEEGSAESDSDATFGSSDISSSEDEDSDSSKPCTILFVLSGVFGTNSKINGLYSPTQETGRDGRMLYRKSGESGSEALCIEHYKGQWQVKYEMDRDSDVCVAFIQGNCALDHHHLHGWNVVYDRDFVHQPSVKLAVVAEAD